MNFARVRDHTLPSSSVIPDTSGFSVFRRVVWIEDDVIQQSELSDLLACGVKPHSARGGYDRMPVQDDKSFSGCSCQMFQSPGQFHIFTAKRLVAEAAEISERSRFDENERAGKQSP